MSCDYDQLPHLGIQNLTPYVPGKSIDELAAEQGLTDIIKLASNENPLGCSYLVREALAQVKDSTIAMYPSATLHPLRRKLSDHLLLDQSMLMLSNGSDFLFKILLITFALHRQKSILTHAQAFSSYAIQAQTLGIPIEFSPLRGDWQVDLPDMIERCNNNISMIFLPNPNNPTGIFIDAEKIEHFLSAIPSSIIIVIDEAYYEFAYHKDNPGALRFLDQYPNLVITRTFSKAYGLAGLRLGYAIAQPDIINLLLRVQLPFTVNQLALEAGLAALKDPDFLRKTLETNTLGMQQMQRGFKHLNLPYLPSSCNFLTVDCGQAALPVYEALLKKGIIVRPLHAYNMPNHLRVSIGTVEQNARFLQALPDCL